MAHENILELSLALLDDAGAVETSKQLEVFADSEKWVEESITLAPASPEAAISEEQKTSREEAGHIVFANNLSQRYNRQKLQNETLIKALQDLRERMNDSKQRSAKLIP